MKKKKGFEPVTLAVTEESLNQPRPFPSKGQRSFPAEETQLARPWPPAMPLQTINKGIPTWHDAQILQIERTINTQEALRAAEIPALPCGVLLLSTIFRGFSVFLWKSIYSLW